MTMCDGEVIYEDGNFTKVDRDGGAARRCTTTCSKALADDEVERRKLSKALLPHVRKFYANYFDPRSTSRSTGRARWSRQVPLDL